MAPLRLGPISPAQIHKTGKQKIDLESKHSKLRCNIYIYPKVSNGKKNQDGSIGAHFIDCVTIGKTADNLIQYQKKGSKLTIDGHLEHQTWINKDGHRRSTIEVFAERIFYESGIKNTDKSLNNINNNKEIENIVEDMFEDSF